MAQPAVASSNRYGTHGRVLIVDLTTRTTRVEELDESVYRQFLGGYGLGAWLMWKHFPPGADALAPEACFAIVSGLLTGVRTPFSGRIQIVGKSPLTGTWADSNSGGSVREPAAPRRLRRAASSRGRASEPTRARGARRRGARSSPRASCGARRSRRCSTRCAQRYGGQCEVGVSAIGPAGEQQSRIASVMNDRYHAFGRQGFGAIYGAKNLKAIVVAGTGEVPIANPTRFRELCKAVTQRVQDATSRWITRFMVWFAKPKRWLGLLYRADGALRHQDRGAAAGDAPALVATAAPPARSRSAIENGDAPIKNWKGVGSRDFPLATKSMKLDGDAGRQVHHQEALVRRLPDAVQGHRRGQEPRPLRRAPPRLRDDRRASARNLLNDDLELVTACHDACNRYGIDAVSSSATLAWVCEAVEEGILTAGRPRRHRHALGQRRGRARAHDQDGHGRGLRRVAAPRRQRARRARRQGQRALRRPRPRRGARVPRPALHLADGRDLHRRSDAGPPHRGLRVVERDLRRRRSRSRAPSTRRRRIVRGRAPRARASRRRTSATRTR